jgi:phosphomevalonate kinase
MVTSLVGGLLSHCGIDVVHAHRADLHNLAQYAHSLAQGKVGSGFDVSAAVYGNQRYRRFSPSNLPDLAGSPEVISSSSSSRMDALTTAQLTAKDLYAALGESTNPVWTSAETKAAITPFTLPPFTALLLADVDMGSNTPSMVSKVLAWRKANVDEAKRLWDDLSAHNDDLAGVFGDLSALAEADEASYREAVRECASWNELQVRPLAARHLARVSGQHSGRRRTTPLPVRCCGDFVGPSRCIPPLIVRSVR